MRKLTRKNLDELAKVMPILNENIQRSFIGGGAGTQEDPYTESEYDQMVASGTWNGGYVDGWGYTFSDLTITGSQGSSNNNDTSGNVSGSTYNPNEWGGIDSGFWNAGGDSGAVGDSGDWWVYGSSGDISGQVVPNTGGGGGGNVSPISGQQMINQIIWESSQSTFINQASILYGIDLSKIIFKASTDRAAYAWIGQNGEVFLGNNFFNLTSDKQLRILLHEYFHIEEDKSYSTEEKNIQTTLPQPPLEIKNYIMNVICEGDEFSYQQIMTHYTLRDPRYYSNEINAYTKERNMFTNISSEEKAELDYRIWYFTELKKLADQYYN
ncbi:MAG: hypothetical protein PHS01_10100 [Dysgonamonadaceae bacterium]|nr:hypothetical protein [Dysgonamonadaceae bacterium]